MVPPSSSKTTGKRQSPGNGHKTLQHQCDSREPGAPQRAGIKALHTWGSWHGGSCPMGCAGTGQAKECLASTPWGEERLFILFSLDFRLNLTHFIYRNCFNPLTRATLLIWVKQRRIWPCDNFKVLGFMFLHL